MEPEKALYTLILDPNQEEHPGHPPMIMETDIELATLEHMRGLKRRTEAGKDFTAKIARVIVRGIDGGKEPRTWSTLITRDDDIIDKLLEDMVDPMFALCRISDDEDASIKNTPWTGEKAALHEQLRAKVLQWIRAL